MAQPHFAVPDRRETVRSNRPVCDRAVATCRAGRARRATTLKTRSSCRRPLQRELQIVFILRDRIEPDRSHLRMPAMDSRLI